MSKEVFTLEQGFCQSEESINGVYDGGTNFDEISIGYGTDWFTLTDENIEQLKQGKVLHLLENGGEYQMFIKLKSEKINTRKRSSE